MKKLNSASRSLFGRLVSLVITTGLSVLVSCSAKGPQEAAQESATSQVSVAEAAVPFSRLADSAGCVLEQVTKADHDEYQVQGASADGTRLAMTARMGESEHDQTLQVYDMDLATGKMTALPDFLTNSGAFSPDGRYQLLAQETDNGKTDIFEYEWATGELRPVAAHENWDWLPSYSPDGQFIVFNSYRVDGQSDIFLFEKSTGALRRLTEHPAYDAHAQFSPDRMRIVFHRQRGTRDGGGYIFDLMVYDLESGQESRLTEGDYEESYPAWAPDGRHLVFSSDIHGQPGKLNLYVLAPDGQTTRLTQGDWIDRYAYWTRDGNYIYFNSERAGPTNIYRLPMAGLACVRQVD